MAISFKFSVEKLNQWFDLNLSDEELSILKIQGVTCKANTEGTKLEFGNESLGIVKDFPIKSGVLKMAKEGVLPIAAKASASKKISAALKICGKQLPDTAVAEEVWKDTETDSLNPKGFSEHLASEMLDEPEPEPGIVAGVDLSDAALAKDKIVHGPEVVDVLMTDKDKALKMPKVKLEEATALYQPVKATSDSSTYHCVGIAGNLKFGARWMSNSNLSIRVEGPVFKHKDKLVAAGFNHDYISKGYTSVHFNGIEELVAKRALGAVLIGTGLEFNTPIPDLGVINGKGT